MLGKVSSLVLQMLTGIAKLRVAGAEMRAFAVWAGQYSIQKSNAAKAQSAANALVVFNSVSGVLTYLVILATVAYVLGGGVGTGEFVAIVGPSGAGKSSLFRQLLGFEEPEAGSVYYDHHKLAELNVQAVRRQMGVVLQNGRLMSGSIFQNIAGVSALTLDQAWEAARMAGLDEDIQMMPMGMFTFLGEGSSAISGGQRQRLMIARAIASKPRIVLFDEATSALDNRSQAIVSSSLQDLKATRIVIAHRLSTIISADRIYVLKAGRIVQSGTYAELMEREGPFRDLAARQIA